MKQLLKRRLPAWILALLMTLSVSAAAFAETPAEPPVVEHDAVFSVTQEGVYPDEADRDYPPLDISENARVWRLRPEEEIWASVTTEVEDKVRAIVAQCRAEGVSGEYATAVWLHDWLTHNANYDYTYSRYTPDGVLLYGSGVCQSYMSAYALLLDEVGIENCNVTSIAMNHTWNLVKLNGMWCHVDVTWDDPGSGGMENHHYFGMSDAAIQLDHSWEPQDIPASTTSLYNYYPLVYGEIYYATEEELYSQLNAAATRQENPISIHYVGTDPDRSARVDFETWLGEKGWEFGVRGWSGSFTQYYFTGSLTYGEVQGAPYKHLDTPVDAPDFTLRGPEGLFRRSSYSGNGLVLIFGRPDDYNTRTLLEDLQDSLSSLRQNGIEVLTSLENASAPGDLNELRAISPDSHFCYGAPSLMWTYLSAAGGPNSITYPCVFVVNGAGQIVYYSTGHVYNMNSLMDEILATAGGKPVPQPEPNDYGTADTGSASLAGLSEGSVKTALQAACANGRRVFFLTDKALYSEAANSLTTWENNYELFDSLGFVYLACIEDVTDEMRAAFPHVAFVQADAGVDHTLELLNAVGHDVSWYYYLSSFYLEPDGRITDYSNGSVLSLWDKVLLSVQTMTYDVSAPASLVALESETFAEDRFSSVDLSTAPVTAIGERAFAGNTALRFVRIPDSVTAIAPDAFDGCGQAVFVCSYNSAAALFAGEHGIEYLCP